MRTKKLFAMMALMLAMAGTGAWAQGTVTFKEGTEDAVAPRAYI